MYGWFVSSYTDLNTAHDGFFKTDTLGTLKDNKEINLLTEIQQPDGEKRKNNYQINFHMKKLLFVFLTAISFQAGSNHEAFRKIDAHYFNANYRNF